MANKGLFSSDRGGDDHDGGHGIRHGSGDGDHGIHHNIRSDNPHNCIHSQSMDIHSYIRSYIHGSRDYDRVRAS